jgi:hypothetical protein
MGVAGAGVGKLPQDFGFAQNIGNIKHDSKSVMLGTNARAVDEGNHIPNLIELLSTDQILDDAIFQD